MQRARVVVWFLDASDDAVVAVLAGTLGVEPAEVEIVRDGKPALVRRDGWPDVRFNLSHSGGLAVLAVAEGREVGVDVERHAERDFARLARRAFPREPERTWTARAFHDAWVRKEAVVKAAGGSVLTEVADAGRWTVVGLDVPDGFSGALAVEGGEPAVVTRRRPEG